MSSDRSERIMAIFLGASDLSGAEREQFLAEQCAGDDRLRSEVESLLGAHDRAGRFMAEPTLGANEPLTPEQHRRVEDLFQRLAGLSADQQRSLLEQLCPDDSFVRSAVLGLLQSDESSGNVTQRVREALQSAPLDPMTSRMIGPYKLLSILGEGGFGTVWLAERKEPYSQRVALKIIKPGMDSKAVIARFEQERQALAVMDHPNIARVLDGGMTPADLGSRPFFVMEYVKGEPITTYCDRNTLSIRERLRLFIRVCDAVQHAHQKGIIHRDLKPSNVLVLPGTESDPATPKIIDFGIAKAVSHIAAGATIFTDQGVILGTPEYMSPEQAEMGATDIDTRTDVYSLGVLLYQLLTGLLPLDPETLRRAGYAEIQRIIREVDPPRPSTRLLTGSDSAALAAKRRTETPILARILRGDLDWIVMKCLEKDRTRRYDSASALGLDLDRFLTDKPVAAGPPSRRYVAAKFIRRNKGPVAAVSALMLVLIAGIVGTTIGLVGESRQRKRAENAAESERLARIEADEKRKEADAARELAESESYVANLMAADAGLASGEPVTTQRRLAAAPERLRGWEWKHLNARADRSLTVMRGHERPIVAMECLAGSARVVTGSEDGTVRVWDLSGSSQPVVLSFGETVAKLVASKDGSRFAAGGMDGGVVLWSASSLGDGVRTAGHPEEIWSMAFSPDGNALVTGSTDATARVWDAATGELRRELKGHASTVRVVAFSPDGAILATAGWNEPIILWNANSGERLRSLGNRNYSLNTLQFSPDGTRLVACDFVWMRLFDVSDGSELNADRSLLIAGRRIVYNADGSRIMLCGQEQGPAGSGGIGLYDGRTGKPVLQIKVHKGAVNAGTFSRDGLSILSVGEDSTLRISNAQSGKELAAFRGHLSSVIDLTELQDGRVVTASSDATIRTWDSRAGPDVHTVAFSGSISGARFVPDGSRIVCTSGDGSFRVFDPEGSPLAVLRGLDEDPPMEFAVSPDGCRIAYACQGQNVRLWDLDHARPTGELILPKRHILALSFTPDGEHLAIGANERPIRILDFSGKQVRELLGHDNVVSDLAHSPHGSLLASCSGDRSVRLWDATTGAAAGVLQGHEDWVRCLDWSPDARFLASGSDDQTVRIWDVRSQKPVATLRGHGKNVTRIAFSPDGLRLASGSWDGIIRIWNTATWSELLVIRSEDKILGGLDFSSDSLSLVASGNLLRIMSTRTDLQRLERRKSLLETESAARALLTRVQQIPDSPLSIPDRIRGDAAAKAVRLAALNLHLAEIGKRNEEATMTAFKGSLARYILIDDAIASVTADSSLEPHVRDAAIRLLRNDKDQPGRLIDAAWAIVRHENRTPEEYALALRAAEKSVANHVPHAEFSRRLGVTRYRNGKFEEAIAALKRAAELSGRTPTTSQATDLAFTAMSQFRLGRLEEAAATMSRLREAMKHPAFASDEQALASSREAESLAGTK